MAVLRRRVFRQFLEYCRRFTGKTKSSSYSPNLHKAYLHWENASDDGVEVEKWPRKVKRQGSGDKAGGEWNQPQSM